VLLGLIAALASAVCYGAASVLQARGAARTERSDSIDPTLLVRVLRQGSFVAGIGLDMVGFAAQFVALRRLPLYVVQAALAGNLAVTALLAIPVLGARLGRTQWLAVASVCVGLLLLSVAAGKESDEQISLGFRVGLLVVALVLAAAGFLAGRLPDRLRGAGLGIVAGLSFGVLALAVRGMTDLALGSLLHNPATYALAVAGVAGFLFFASGLQQAAVTTVTAAVVIGETAVPALIGVLFLGDRTRPGLAPLAALGFLLAVAGALLLASFGEPAAAEHPAG
jgi:drug/metabolite transporter (DMT)-like permease